MEANSLPNKNRDTNVSVAGLVMATLSAFYMKKPISLVVITKLSDVCLPQNSSEVVLEG